MAKLSRRARRLLGVPLGVAVGAACAALAPTSLGERAEALTTDVRLFMRGERELDPRILLIELDDDTLQTLARYPIPRGYWGSVIQTARDHGALVVGFDTLFLEASTPEMDELLARPAKACACAIFPSELSPRGDEFSAASPIELIASASAAVAHVQLDNTLDGIFRGAYGDVVADGKTYLPLSAAIAKVAGVEMHPPPSFADTGRAIINWRSVNPPLLKSVTLLEILEAQQQIDAGEKPALDLGKLFKGKIVVAGQTAKSIGDRGPVPVWGDRALVLAHINALDNVMNDRFLVRAPLWATALLSLVLATLVGLAATARRAWESSLVVVVVVAGLWLVGFFAFTRDAWVPLAAPTIAALVAFGAASAVNVAVRDADEKKLRSAFDRYVAPHILDKILERADDVDILGGHKRTITLLFSDIKGYTTLSNTLAAEQIVELLCSYLDTMVEILLKHEGTVDKIMGDGIMAFFGDPLPQDDHALRTVKAALEMQAATAKLGEQWVERGLSPLQVRIGIATGEVFVGSIGSRHHLEYTAIGRPVNLASRLEGKAPPGGVLVSSETYELVKNDVVAREVRGLDLKGYIGGYDAWVVTGLVGQEQNVVAIDERRGDRREFFSDVTLTLDGNDLVARSSDISPGGMFITCETLPPEGAHVKVRAQLTGAPAGWGVQMDAVVTHVRNEKPGAGAGLMFTTVFADDRQAIMALLEGVVGHDSFEEARLAEVARGAPSSASSSATPAPAAPAPARFSYKLERQAADDHGGSTDD